MAERKKEFPAVYKGLTEHELVFPAPFVRHSPGLLPGYIDLGNPSRSAGLYVLDPASTIATFDIQSLFTVAAIRHIWGAANDSALFEGVIAANSQEPTIPVVGALRPIMPHNPYRPCLR